MDYKPLHFYRFPCGCEGICLGPAELPEGNRPSIKALVLRDCGGDVAAKIEYPNAEGFGREAEELDPDETAKLWATGLRGRLDAADTGDRLARSIRDAMALVQASDSE